MRWLANFWRKLLDQLKSYYPSLRYRVRTWFQPTWGWWYGKRYLEIYVEIPELGLRWRKVLYMWCWRDEYDYSARQAEQALIEFINKITSTTPVYL